VYCVGFCGPNNSTFAPFIIEPEEHSVTFTFNVPCCLQESIVKVVLAVPCAQLSNVESALIVCEPEESELLSVYV